jgi:hypothetical protein
MKKSVDNPAKTRADLSSQGIVDQFRRAAKQLTDKATATPDTARELLVSEGIYTKSGRLSKNYS